MQDSMQSAWEENASTVAAAGALTLGTGAAGYAIATLLQPLISGEAAGGSKLAELLQQAAGQQDDDQYIAAPATTAAAVADSNSSSSSSTDASSGTGMADHANEGSQNSATVDTSSKVQQQTVRRQRLLDNGPVLDASGSKSPLQSELGAVVAGSGATDQWASVSGNSTNAAAVSGTHPFGVNASQGATLWERSPQADTQAAVNPGSTVLWVRSEDDYAAATPALQQQQQQLSWQTPQSDMEQGGSFQGYSAPVAGVGSQEALPASTLSPGPVLWVRQDDDSAVQQALGTSMQGAAAVQQGVYDAAAVTGGSDRWAGAGMFDNVYIMDANESALTAKTDPYRGQWQQNNTAAWANAAGANGSWRPSASTYTVASQLWQQQSGHQSRQQRGVGVLRSSAAMSDPWGTNPDGYEVPALELVNLGLLNEESLRYLTQVNSTTVASKQQEHEQQSVAGVLPSLWGEQVAADGDTNGSEGQLDLSGRPLDMEQNPANVDSSNGDSTMQGTYLFDSLQLQASEQVPHQGASQQQMDTSNQGPTGRRTAAVQAMGLQPATLQSLREYAAAKYQQLLDNAASVDEAE